MTVDARILLVTWTPPGNRNVGEIILRDLCSFLPRSALYVCEVSNFPEQESEYLKLKLNAPDERPWRPVPGRVGGLLNYLHVQSRFKIEARAICGPIREFAQKHEVDRIWFVLSTQALIAIAGRLAGQLKLPLLSLVWDPPEFLARHAGWDSGSLKWSLGNFKTAMRMSTRAMVVSDAMVKQYEQQYGVPCTIVRHAFKDKTGPAIEHKSDGPIRIGFAGTLYDEAQLNLLVEALNLMNWKLGNRQISLRIVGNRYRFTSLAQPAHVELLGWQDTERTRTYMNECDVTYLPVPFTAYFREFALLAFPTKLSTYLAAGPPILVHAPADSAPAMMCRERDFGILCTSMKLYDLRHGLEQVLNSEIAERLRRNVSKTRSELFSRSVMRKQFAEFIGIDVEDLKP